MIAIAMDIKAQQVGFYSCGFASAQGTFLANYGTFYLSGCHIEGSSDFFWGYGTAFVSNSLIVSNTPGYSIAAQSYVTNYPSQCVKVPCFCSYMLSRDFESNLVVLSDVKNTVLDYDSRMVFDHVRLSQKRQLP
jgi:hypothetical protein